MNTLSKSMNSHCECLINEQKILMCIKDEQRQGW
jgi:hypothetical protein